MLLLSLKNVRMIKIAPHRIPTTRLKNPPPAKFPILLPLNTIWKALYNWRVLAMVYFICEHLNGISSLSTGVNDDYNNRIRPESG